LAEHFDVVEIDDTWRRMPRPERSRVWLRRVRANPRFQFTACLHSAFTEARILDEASAREFRDGLSPLSENGRLGAVLLQFPWSFRFTAENRDYLIRLRRSLHPLPVVAEFLHASWSASEALGTLIDFKIGFCNLDQPQQTKTMAPSSFLTSATGYVRLRRRQSRGGQSCEYPDPVLEDWCARVRHIAGFADRVFVIAANKDRIETASRIRRLLQEPKRREQAALRQALPAFAFASGRGAAADPPNGRAVRQGQQSLLDRLEGIAVA
jgi:uncharacterized protein YecE (DUF72 family)